MIATIEMIVTDVGRGIFMARDATKQGYLIALFNSGL
jgi:hypothetical protein